MVCSILEGFNKAEINMWLQIFQFRVQEPVNFIIRRAMGEWVINPESALSTRGETGFVDEYSMIAK